MNLPPLVADLLAARSCEARGCTCAHEVEHTIDRDGTGRLTIRHDDWCPALQSRGVIVLTGGNP
ncbi:MAG: hypothetical protein M5T61_19020 [Acidimicrobiia bacterium]|nr:hypothetical protein [Acidimicrobiia bacterium]